MHTLAENWWEDSNCCSKIFDPKPFFSSAGVCFTTKSYDLPRVSKILRPDKIVLNVAENYSEGKCNVVVVILEKCFQRKKLQKDLNNNSPHLGYRLHSK